MAGPACWGVSAVGEGVLLCRFAVAGDHIGSPACFVFWLATCLFCAQGCVVHVICIAVCHWGDI